MSNQPAQGPAGRWYDISPTVSIHSFFSGSSTVSKAIPDIFSAMKDKAPGGAQATHQGTSKPCLPAPISAPRMNPIFSSILAGVLIEKDCFFSALIYNFCQSEAFLIFSDFRAVTRIAQIEVKYKGGNYGRWIQLVLWVLHRTKLTHPEDYVCDWKKDQVCDSDDENGDDHDPDGCPKKSGNDIYVEYYRPGEKVDDDDNMLMRKLSYVWFWDQY